MSVYHIPVQTGTPYEVIIGPGLLDRCGALLAEAAAPCRAAVITDSNVAPLYLARAERSLRNTGFDTVHFVFPAGEGSKHLGTLSDILEFLAEAGLTRGDMAVALGGGVTGDMTGFAAGCYLRGIRFVQLPTTLLAAVDSSVGGKTAVDLKAGKNLAGLFLQPLAVICDTDCLQTLPPEVLADGAAEAVKTGVLAGESLFALCEKGPTADLSNLIAGCVSHKAAVVEADERELGLRKTLNLGHTVGHAVEKCSGYAIPHGHAVAMGLGVIARAAAKFGFCDEHCARRIQAALAAWELPVTAPYGAAQLAEAARFDKKRSRDHITLALPLAMGDCVLHQLPMDELEAFIAAGLEVL